MTQFVSTQTSPAVRSDLESPPLVTVAVTDCADDEGFRPVKLEPVETETGVAVLVLRLHRDPLVTTPPFSVENVAFPTTTSSVPIPPH
jgi:hypothetical protein